VLSIRHTVVRKLVMPDAFFISRWNSIKCNSHDIHSCRQRWNFSSYPDRLACYSSNTATYKLTGRIGRDSCSATFVYQHIQNSCHIYITPDFWHHMMFVQPISTIHNKPPQVWRGPRCLKISYRYGRLVGEDVGSALTGLCHI
jgi:hypothetical protein